MRNISKILKSLLVGALIINTPVNEAKAFFLMPPMPWDVELDVPANANKIVANSQTLYRQYQTYASELNTGKLQAIKKAAGLQFGNLKNKTLSSEGKGKAKTPLKKEVKNNNELGIEKNDLNEKHYFNAYHKLFFIYPPMEGDGKGQIKLSNDATADYPVLQTAYKHMTTKYRQDVIVDTYLTGRLTEDYLAVVDKTLQRLDMCLNQDWGKAGLNEQKCTFFGLHMVEVKNNNQAPSDPEGDNSGQLGAAMNAYVVTTVYDRLLRIVEDLTATEAVYRAAKQLDMADPIMPEQQSSAEKYLPKTYQFAHNEIYEHSHAKSLLNSYERTKACENGGTGCPDKNKDKTEAANIDNTDVLGKLQPIDEMLSKAVQLHNLKNQMPEYKAQFRKYKKAKEIHARALKTVEQSDQCVQDFLKRHGGKNIVWGTSKPANDYESRSGISYELIRAYEQAIKDTIIGTTAECEGYYSTQNSCPEGYVLDTKEYCRYVDKDGKMVSKPSLHPCVVETVAYDTEGSENNSDIPNDYEEAGGNLLQKISSGNDSYDNADYLIESGNADKIELDNRKKSEQAWRIGYNKMMELTENGSLKFAPWNDQQNLQEEYLHNKYRNMRIIIKSVDQGAKSYQIAAALANNTTYTGKEPIRDLIRDVTECASLDEARNAAYQEYCAGYPKTTNVFVTKNGVTQNKTVQLTCGVTKNDNNGVLTGKRMEKVNGEIVEQTKEWKQIVSANRNCPFKGTRKTSLPETENNAYKCAGSWDFTVKTLVKKYFPAVLGGCSANPEERVYNEAQNHGRKIAKDYFNDVLQARRNGEQTILNVVKTYNDGLNQDKKALQSAKDSIKIYNQQINEATEEKNRLIKEVKRTKQRTADIKNEKTDIEQRLKSDVIVEKDKCALKIKLALLDNESSCINNQNASINTNACPSECSDKKEMREKQCQQLKTFNCKTYVRDTSYIENSKPGTSELTFVIPSLAEKKIAELNAKISKAKAAQREIKDNVKSLEDKIKEKAENFAQLYLAISSAEQAAIDLANKNFEDFLESADGTSSPNRMKDVKHRKCCGPLGLCTKRCDRNYATDNLQTTLEQTTYHGENLEAAIKYGSSENTESLNSVWFKNMNISSLASNLQSIGVPASFVTDGSVLGLAAGPQSAVIMADAIINKGAKEEVLDLAAKTIASHIKQADKIIKEEVDKAVNDVNKMAQSLGVLNTNTISREQASYILKPENYADIVNRHNVLIKNITQPLPANTLILQKAGMELSEIFGIPDTIKTDEEYFVGLPARGDNYNGRDIEKDKDAGRDYYAPKGPLLNLPPVREVFYYSALDYDDTPKNDSYPAISYLLNFKYPDGEKIEYMPEIWRYLLARPNLRSDGKYQRTFVERSLNTNDLKKLLDAPSGESSNNYRTLIGRGGIYPCKIRDNLYIDIEGGNDEVSGLTYKLRTSMPQGAATAPLCQEVAFNNIYGTNSCYVYNKDKSGICQVKADHGKRPDVNDIQTSLSQTTNGLFNNYSELGQFIDGNLKYRPLQENILAYQIDNKNNQNDITRQKADTATFKRNIMGAFLEAVNMEHGAKENLDRIENDMKDMLISLCEQLHEANWTVSNDKNETAETCATYIMNHGGLAENGEDTKYGEKGEYGNQYGNYETIKCPSSKTLYENIFCNLKDLKGEALSKALNGYSYKDKETGETIVAEGYNKVKTQADSRIKERIENIEKYITMLTKDNLEVLFLTSNTTKDQLTPEKIAGEKNNRALARIAEDEGIKSMDNQSQSVAYCPIY